MLLLTDALTVKLAQIFLLSEMKNFKCAIFDLDGTLLDSSYVWNQVDADFFANHNLVMPASYPKIISPLGAEGAAKYTIEQFNLKETPQQVMAQWYHMAQEKFANEVLVKPYAKEYLEKLKKNGVCLAIATASSEDIFMPTLERNEVAHLFDSITVIKEVKRGKGFPDIYLKAAEKCGFPVSECVVFEDIYEGIKGAKAGGFRTVAIYDKSSADDEEIIRSLSDEYIYSFSELL